MDTNVDVYLISQLHTISRSLYINSFEIIENYSLRLFEII